MSPENPKFWALIGFGVGAVIASGGLIVGPLDSLLGGTIQAGIWFGVSSLILRKRAQSVSQQNQPSGKKICEKCQGEVTRNRGHCESCLGTAFREPKEIEKKINKKSTQIKICDTCKSQVHVFYPKCFKCEGTTFTHSLVDTVSQISSLSSEEAIWSAFQNSNHESSEVLNSEFKTCPMCAEEIKYRAKKCRYCQHMMDK